MQYRLTSKNLGALPLGTPFIELPPLGAGPVYSALNTLHALYHAPNMPGLLTSRLTILSQSNIVGNTWRHETDDGIIVVHQDLSVLLFAKTENPNIFEMLPLVFCLKHRSETDPANMRLGFRFRKNIQLGFHPQEDSSVFYNLEKPQKAPDYIQDLLQSTLKSLEVESKAWIQKFAGQPVQAKGNLPIALSRFPDCTLPDGIEGTLLKWLTKISSYINSSLCSDSNAIAIRLRDPVFSQENGSVLFSTEIQFADVEPTLRKALEKHLTERISSIIARDKAPFSMQDLFPRIPIWDEDSFLAKKPHHLNVNVQGFSIVAMSNHEQLQMEAQFGIRSLLHTLKQHST